MFRHPQKKSTASRTKVEMQRKIRIRKDLFDPYRLRRLTIIWRQRIDVLMNSDAGHSDFLDDESMVDDQQNDSKKRSSNEDQKSSQPGESRNGTCRSGIGVCIRRDLNETISQPSQEPAKVAIIVDLI